MQQSVPPRAAPITLTDLPLELRKQIYGYVVVDEYALCSSRRYGFSRSFTANVFRQPNLAMVSRTIRSEALEVFLSRNIFSLRARAETHLSSPAELISRWRLTVGGRLRHVRRLTLSHHESVSDFDGKTRRLWTEYTLSLGAEVVVKHRTQALVGEPHWVGPMYERCACELERSLRLEMQAAGGYDGMVLLQSAGNLDKITRRLRCTDCAICRRSRLVEATPESR